MRRIVAAIVLLMPTAAFATTPQNVQPKPAQQSQQQTQQPTINMGAARAALMQQQLRNAEAARRSIPQK